MMKHVVLGVSGGIAAYKACEIVGLLKKSGCSVDVILTENAERFVSRLTFETLSGNRTVVDTFERPAVYEVEHIALAKKADVFLIAPATANVIGKIANGIADDMLTTTVMAARCVKVICPAMNTAMYENPIVQQNLDKLKGLGYVVIEPAEGLLACGDTGKGRLAAVSDIAASVAKLLEKKVGCSEKKSDYSEKKVLVTAGATRETIDGVRFISNYSSGKMGVALAEAAADRGAAVTLVAAFVKDGTKNPNIKVIPVKTTSEMYGAVLNETPNQDVIIKAAAPADYRVKTTFENKIKEKELTLTFEKNPDIAAAVGKIKTAKQALVIFNAETENLIENARKKLKSKNADMVVANDVTREGAGFEVDTNIVTILTNSGSVYDYPRLPKREVADIILDRLSELLGESW
ncbi:MAG: bifunctional phosphopantothenoylcysteine decarboxylase/phosphopantothenate--cysteine ligase CoaBC [Clostridiales bacterium]|jgi:phosphopantothenoylcysteine decarboxylase/phosphopantothenate--cysteine ligase|nr:bifunctional phosphopantothenoylcysteine decarboxylase/phosphopantothenate--cysteine ligase CoaBC [Clostridiales bacterium]